MKKIAAHHIILVLGFFWSCTSTDLRIQDLKFDDTEKEPIRINKIRKSFISYDSTSLDKTHVNDASFTDKQFISFCKEGIGTKLINYDSNGNIIYDNIREFMGTIQRFEFDTLNLLRKKDYTTDFTADYIITYQFDSKSRKLYQFWKYGNKTDTTIFLFNSSGLVTSEKGHLHDDKSIDRLYSKDYHYKKDTICKIITFYKKDYKNLIRTEEDYYYTKGKIHKIKKMFNYSVIDIHISPFIIKLVKEFDDKGLPKRYIETYHENNTVIKLIKNENAT